MSHRLLILIAFAGCAEAATPDEDSGIETALSGGVTLKERKVPDAVLDALHDITGAKPTVRRFDITAPDETGVDERVRGAVEGLFHRTRLGGHYSLIEYCANLTPPQTEAVGCADAILAGARKPGDFDQYLDDFGGEIPGANEEIRGYLATQLGTVANELALTVPVGHFEDGEFWLDYTACRAILFDPDASQVVLMRYFTTSSL